MHVGKAGNQAPSQQVTEEFPLSRYPSIHVTLTVLQCLLSAEDRIPDDTVRAGQSVDK